MPSSVTSGFTADKALFPGHPSFRRMLTAPEGPLLPVLSMDMVLGGDSDSSPRGTTLPRGPEPLHFAVGRDCSSSAKLFFFPAT